MKNIITAVAVILIATGAYADPQYQQPQSQTQYQGQESHSNAQATGIGIGMAGASATGGSVKSDIKNTNTNLNTNLNTAVGIGGQGGKAVSGSIAVAPTTVSPSQTVTTTVNGVPVTQGVTITPAPVVVQEAQKVVPGSLPFMAQPNPPLLQPAPIEQGTATRGAQSFTPRTAGSRSTLWDDGVKYDYADLPIGDVSSDVEIRGVKIKSRVTRTKAPTELVIYKPTAAKSRAAKGEVIWTGIVKAKKPGMIYAELEMEAMNYARSIGGSGINELDRHFEATTTQSGWSPQAGMLGSIIGSAFGQGALWGPSIGVTYQSYVANTKVTYYIEFEVLR